MYAARKWFWSRWSPVLTEQTTDTNQINLDYMNTKLEFLEKFQGRVNAAVAGYINEVLSTGKAWMENSGDQATFLKISREVDNAVDFLSLKCKEISEQHKAQTSVENTSQKRQQVLKSAGRPLPMPPVKATSQCGCTTVSDSEKDFPHQVLARFGVNEEAVSSLRSNMEKATEKQADTDKRFQNVEAELLKINKQLSALSMAEKQQNKRLTEHTDKIIVKQAEIQKHCDYRIQSFEKIVKKLSTKQDKLEEERCSRDDMNEELNRKMTDIIQDTEIIKWKISGLENNLTETTSSIKDLLNRVVSQEEITQFLCTKVDTDMERLETFSINQLTNLREFEERLQVTETRVKEELKKVGEKFQETEISFKNACQLVANRLKPLEELRSILNQRARTQNDNARQLQDMVKEVAAISPKLTQLESQFTTSTIGFTASTFVVDCDVVDSVITSYGSSSCNDGDHFDLDTGIFKAPVAGTYVAFIRIFKPKDENKDDEDEDSELIIQVRHKSIELADPVRLCWCEIESRAETASACDLCFLQMKAGDTLYAEVKEKVWSVVGYFTFSCFMIR